MGEPHILFHQRREEEKDQTLNVFSCISLRAHPPSRVAGIRNVQDGWGGAPSGSCYNAVLYWADPATMLFYTERILLLYYTIPILSGSCYNAILYRYRADPAAILYCPEWRVLRTGIPKISPSSSWIQSTVASCMTSDQWSSSPHYSGKNIRCHFRCCLLLPESVAHNGLLEYFQLGHPIYSALKLALNFDMLAVDDALGNWHKLNSMRYQVANIIFVQFLTKYWNCE